MKNLKKIFALLIAMVMVLGLSTAAFAADGDLTVDDKIEVQDLVEGDVVTYYQVIEWVDGEGWAFKEPFTSLTAEDLATIVGTEDAAGAIDQVMAKKIAAAATSGSEAGGTVDASGVWTKANPDAGLYMVVIAAAESGVVYNPVFVAADFSEDSTTNVISITATYGNTGIAKKTNITVDKTEEDHDSAVAAAIDSYVGETVDFKVKTTIPVFLPTYKNPSFELTDKVTAGIELDPDSIEVTLDPAATGTPYTITPNGTTSFTVTFDEDYLKENATAVSVTVNYSGKVTNEAEFNVNQDENDVTVIYSNGPDTEKGALKDETNTYVFSIGAKLLGDEEKKTSEIVKVAVKDGEYVVEEIELDNEKSVGALAGATFGLYTDSDAKTLYTNDLYPDGATFTTGDDGVITFNGLSAGTYYLKETDAPAGYIKDATVHTVVITPTYEEVEVKDTVTVGGEDIAVTYKTDVLKSYTVSYDGEEIEFTVTNDGPTATETTINEDSFEVPNTPGVELPSTGGIGTTIFYIVGAILVLGACVVLVSYRRMSANK